MKTPDGFIKNYLFKSTLLNPDIVIASISWLTASCIIFILWRYGHLLKNVLNNFSISLGILEEITYKSIAFGFPIFTIGSLIFGALWAAKAWGTGGLT